MDYLHTHCHWLIMDMVIEGISGNFFNISHSHLDSTRYSLSCSSQYFNIFGDIVIISNVIPLFLRKKVLL